jgi:hypothetical protein
MKRPTPFDMLFGDDAGALGTLTAAAAAAGRDAGDRGEFAMVPEVQRLLAELESPELVAQQPEAVQEYLELLHAMYRFDTAGRRVVSPARAQLQPWLRRLPPAEPPKVPGGACYVQLPAHWWWGQRGPDAPHEPLDGVFVVAAPRGDEVTLLAVLGLREERGGFTQVTVHARPEDFAAARGVQRDPPFAPLMDGGTSGGVLSVATPAELLTLVQLALLAVAHAEGEAP